MTDRPEIKKHVLVDLSRLCETLAVDRKMALIIFEMSGSRRIIEFNSGAEAIFGYSREEMINSAIVDFPQSVKDRHLFQTQLQNIADASASRPVEMTLTRKNREMFLGMVALNPLYNTAGEIVAILWITVDLSDRRRFDQQINQALEAAEGANRVKDAFLATISHEIRTPMNAVLGFTKLLLETSLDAKQKEYTNFARESAKNLMTLLDSILDFAKIESGKLELELFPFVPEEVVHEVVRLFSVKASEKKLALESRFKGDAKTPLLGDGERIRQVLLNLVSNAIKFTQSGSVVISVIIEECTPGTAEIVVEVEDTGVGIDDRKRETLFGRFFQGDSSATRRFGGTGLGLAICRHLVEKMGGQITARKGQQRGSVFAFTVSLPIVKVAGKPDLSFAASAVPQNEMGNGVLFEGISGKCLVIDDDPPSRKLINEILTGVGLQSDMAVDGQEALRMLAKSSYEVILLDCLMPEMDGFQTAREIRRLEQGQRKHTPILGLTGLARKEDLEDCRQAGMDDVLVKPVRLSSLLEKLQVLLRIKQPLP